MVYKRFKVSKLIMFLVLLNKPIAFVIFLHVASIWFFQLIFSSIKIPSVLEHVTRLIYFRADWNLRFRSYLRQPLLRSNKHVLCFLTLRDNLFANNQWCNFSSSLFNLISISSIEELDTVTLVSSANVAGTELLKQFGKSFIEIVMDQDWILDSYTLL